MDLRFDTDADLLANEEFICLLGKQHPPVAPEAFVPEQYSRCLTARSLRRMLGAEFTSPDFTTFGIQRKLDIFGQWVEHSLEAGHFQPMFSDTYTEAEVEKFASSTALHLWNRGSEIAALLRNNEAELAHARFDALLRSSTTNYGMRTFNLELPAMSSSVDSKACNQFIERALTGDVWALQTVYVKLALYWRGQGVQHEHAGAYRRTIAKVDALYQALLSIGLPDHPAEVVLGALTALVVE